MEAGIAVQDMVTFVSEDGDNVSDSTIEDGNFVVGTKVHFSLLAERNLMLNLLAR